MPMPAAPRPIWPTTQDLRSRFTRWVALMSAARVTTAVPCWSSCSTGFFRRFTSCSSTSKHSGAPMSSRWMAPKEDSMAITVSMICFGSVSLSRMGMPEMPVNLA